MDVLFSGGCCGGCLGVCFFTIRETSYFPEDHGVVSGRKRTQWQWMSLTMGYDRRASFGRTIVDILANAAYPPLLWCSFTIGISVGW